MERSVLSSGSAVAIPASVNKTTHVKIFFKADSSAYQDGDTSSYSPDVAIQAQFESTPPAGIGFGTSEAPALIG